MELKRILGLTRGGALLMFIVFFSQSVLAQNDVAKAPDYKVIEKAIKKRNSPFYYPRLFKRYLKGDSTLSKTDARYLYYGYLFNKNFKLYDNSGHNDSLRAIFRQDTLTLADYARISQIEQKILEDFPFNPGDLNILSNCYVKLGETASAKVEKRKLNLIINAILSSGDGLTDTTGWHVIKVSHEYDILDALGFTFGGEQSLTGNNCDYLKVTNNKYGVKGVYFDVKQLMIKEVEELK